MTLFPLHASLVEPLRVVNMIPEDFAINSLILKSSNSPDLVLIFYSFLLILKFLNHTNNNVCVDQGRYRICCSEDQPAPLTGFVPLTHPVLQLLVETLPALLQQVEITIKRN